MSTEKTFSQEIIQKANKTVSITDDLGRIIVLRKPKLSHYLNLIKSLGKLAENQTYVDHVTIFSAVVSIDGNLISLKAPIDIDWLVLELEKSDNALLELIKAVKDNFSDISNEGGFSEELKK